MKRFKLALVALAAIVFPLFAGAAPAQAASGPFREGQTIVKTGTSTTYRVAR